MKSSEKRNVYPISKSGTTIWLVLAITEKIMDTINKEYVQQQLDNSRIENEEQKHISIITPQVYQIGKIRFSLHNIVNIGNRNVSAFLMNLFTMHNEWAHDKITVSNNINTEGVRKYTYLSENNILKHIEQVLDNPPYFIILKYSVINFNKMMKNKR